MDSLTRIKAFVEVVEAQGYSPAARKMGRSKALLSKYVRELEDELGTLLINRTTRQFSLTEAGQRFFDSCLDILARIVEAQEIARSAGSGLGGTLRVSAPRAVSGNRLDQVLADFAVAYPDIRLEVHLDDRLVDLVEERFDVAIRIGKLDDSSLIARRLADNRVVICASPAFFAEHGKPDDPRQLAGMRAIVDTNFRGKSNWVFVGKDGNEFTVTVTPVMEVNDPLVARAAALRGVGIVAVPEFAVAEDIAEGRLETVFQDSLPTGAGFHAVYAHRRHVPAKVRVFVDFMAEWFRNDAKAGK